MIFLPWWLLLLCLVGSAFVAYLLLERTQAGDSPWAHYPLTAVLASVVLAGTVFVGITLSTVLSALLEDQSAQPPDEGTGAESTLERTVPATRSTPPSTTSPSASPSASSTASPASSPTASPTASPNASPSASPSP